MVGITLEAKKTTKVFLSILKKCYTALKTRDRSHYMRRLATEFYYLKGDVYTVIRNDITSLASRIYNKFAVTILRLDIALHNC